MGKINWLFSLLLIALLISLKFSYACQGFIYSYCPKSAANSNYSSNLNTLLESLSSSAANSSTGFAAARVGENTNDAVYGLFLCRGDLNRSSCSDCVNAAAKGQYCVGSKMGIIWYDECTVRFDHQNLFGRMDQDHWYSQASEQVIIGNQTTLLQLLKDIMEDLAVETASGGSLKKYGTRAVNITGSQTLYALEQCTPDLSTSDCKKCLTTATGRIDVREGVKVLQGSCNLRFEAYKFFDGPVKFSYPPPPSSSSSSSSSSLSKSGTGKRRAEKVWIVVCSLLILGLFLLLATVRFWFLRRKGKKAKKDEKNYEIQCVDSFQFDYDVLEAATENFSDAKRLHKGASVTKGLLPSGQEIVVKRLFKKGRDTEQKLNNEVLLLANLQHRNLVKLLGFCITKDAWLLVHEFQPNESLDLFLRDDPIKRARLDWGTRYKIVMGIARGLLYLHEDSQLMVIHRGLNASNILLDVEMNPKISNFGRASHVRVDEPVGVTNKIKVTHGYMPPEYVQQGHFSIKSDVFSFGVLLLEVINGRMISNFSDREHEDNLLCYAWKKWSEGEALDVVDKTLDSIESHTSQIIKCTKIALLCVQEDPESRPTMSSVVFMLNSSIDAIAEPSKPAYINSTDVVISSSNSPQSNQGSMNEVSISMLDAR